MAVNLGKNLILPFLGAPSVGGASQAVSGAQAPKAFKTSAYAAIPYERAPQVTDTVNTKDANGKPLLDGYVTPNKVWVA